MLKDQLFNTKYFYNPAIKLLTFIMHTSFTSFTLSKYSLIYTSLSLWTDHSLYANDNHLMHTSLTLYKMTTVSCTNHSLYANDNHVMHTSLTLCKWQLHHAHITHFMNKIIHFIANDNHVIQHLQVKYARILLPWNRPFKFKKTIQRLQFNLPGQESHLKSC